MLLEYFVIKKQVEKFEKQDSKNSFHMVQQESDL